jgi:hypothetical protein
MSDTTRESTPEPPKPRGRCGSCGEIVLIEDTFLKGDEGKEVRVHRRGATRKNIVGVEICGPVVDSFVFHVYAKVQEEGKPERTIRTFLRSLESPKERISVLTDWETELERARTIEGEPKPTVVVDSWSLIGSL